MSARGIIGGLAGMAASAVKHPKSTTEQALLGAKEMATTGVIVADKLLKKGKGKAAESTGSTRSRRRPRHGRPPLGDRDRRRDGGEGGRQGREDAPRRSRTRADEVETKAAGTRAGAPKPRPRSRLAKKAPAKKAPAKKAPAKKAAAKKSPRRRRQSEGRATTSSSRSTSRLRRRSRRSTSSARPWPGRPRRSARTPPRVRSLPPVRDKDEAARRPGHAEGRPQPRPR